MGGDRLAEQPVMRLAVRLGALLAKLRAERRRADEVGEEDRRGPGVRSGRLGGHPSGGLLLLRHQGQGRLPSWRDGVSAPVTRTAPGRDPQLLTISHLGLPLRTPPLGQIIRSLRRHRAL
jgi:hypothetical protein